MRVSRWRGALWKMSASSHGVGSERAGVIGNRGQLWAREGTPHQCACRVQNQSASELNAVAVEGEREGGKSQSESGGVNSPILSTCSAPTAEIIASARTAILCGSVSSTSCAMRDQLSRLRATCDVSYSRRWMTAPLKSCTTSAAGRRGRVAGKRRLRGGGVRGH